MTAYLWITGAVAAVLVVAGAAVSIPRPNGQDALGRAMVGGAIWAAWVAVMVAHGIGWLVVRMA